MTDGEDFPEARADYEAYDRLMVGRGHESHPWANVPLRAKIELQILAERERTGRTGPKDDLLDQLVATQE